MKERTYRMYGLVNYQLSGIQKGIQFGHAVQEYNNLMVALHTDVMQSYKDAFNQWRKEDKTFIILNGGTTNSNPENIGTLNKYLIEATDNGVLCASFREPDLGDQLTAFVFLVDDRVFNREVWKDYDGLYENCYPMDHEAYWHWKMKFAETEDEANRIVWLRNWLRNFKLA